MHADGLLMYTDRVGLLIQTVSGMIVINTTLMSVQKDVLGHEHDLEVEIAQPKGC